MTVLEAARPNPSTSRQWWVLTVRIITPTLRNGGVTPAGGLYTVARARIEGEFAGAVFSPDGSTLFVNIQQSGVTLAITGPWRTS